MAMFSFTNTCVYILQRVGSRDKYTWVNHKPNDYQYLQGNKKPGAKPKDEQTGKISGTHDR